MFPFWHCRTSQHLLKLTTSFAVSLHYFIHWINKPDNSSGRKKELFCCCFFLLTTCAASKVLRSCIICFVSFFLFLSLFSRHSHSFTWNDTHVGTFHFFFLFQLYLFFSALHMYCNQRTTSSFLLYIRNILFFVTKCEKSEKKKSAHTVE